MSEPEKKKPDPISGPLGDLAVAVAFLTVLPVPTRVWDGPVSLGRSFSWFPLVGLLLGAALGAAGLLFSSLLPPGVAAALLVALWVLLTGGLHLDGLMDASDGLFCSKTPGERLAVMRDSRIGAFGVLGAVCVLLVKYAALAALLTLPALPLFCAVALAPVLGRWAMTLSVVAFPYNDGGPGGGSGDTLGEAFTSGAGSRQLVVASGWCLAVVGTLAVSQGSLAPPVALGVAALATATVAGFALSRLPGLTGDVYGATGEAVEAVALVVFAGWFL